MEINKLMTTNALLEKERRLHMEMYAFTQLIIYFTLFLRLSNIDKGIGGPLANTPLIFKS